MLFSFFSSHGPLVYPKASVFFYPASYCFGRNAHIFRQIIERNLAVGRAGFKGRIYGFFPLLLLSVILADFPPAWEPAVSSWIPRP